MTFRIPRGRHRARPFRFGFWLDRNSFSWTIKFTDSCRYDLQSDDQFDVNKLIGIGYLPGHHKDSARFGWQYDKEIDRIVLHAYCYVNGQRVSKSICSCEIGKTYRIELRVSTDAYYFACDEKDVFYYRTNGEATVTHRHKKRFGYRLGVWFGGNRVAPHDINIQLEKA